MPSENIIVFANFMAQQLVPHGYKIGTGEPNSIVIYLREKDNLKSEDDFTTFVAMFLKTYKMEIQEVTEFHFYKGSDWLGGVVFNPKRPLPN